jgi:predicted ATPase
VSKETDEIKTEEPKTSLKSWDEVNLKLNVVRKKTIQRDKLQVKQDALIQKAMGKYDSKILAVQKELTDTVLDIAAYAQIHNTELPQKFKSGLIKKSLNPRALVPIKDESAAIKKLKKLFEGKLLQAYLTVTETLNKTALKKLDESELKKAGLKTVQG